MAAIAIVGVIKGGRALSAACDGLTVNGSGVLTGAGRAASSGFGLKGAPPTREGRRHLQHCIVNTRTRASRRGVVGFKGAA